MFCQYCVVNDVLEDFNDEVQVKMRAFDQVAVFVVGLAIRNKHPEAFHDFAVSYHLARVRLRIVPYVLADALQ